MKFTYVRLLATLILSLLLSSCFIDSSEDPSANVSLKSVESPEAVTFSPGQPFSVDFTISNDRIEAENVGVVFFIIESSKVSQLVDNQAAEDFFVGHYLIDNLEQGDSTYTANLMVPNDIGVSGEYTVAAVLDPSGIITDESTTQDNLSRDFEQAGSQSFGTMQIDTEHHHDFILSKVEIGEGFLLLPEPVDHDQSESGLPDTMHSDLIGFFDAIKHGSNLDTAIVRGTITVAGVDYDAHFWREEDDEYTDSMDIIFPNHEEEHYFPFDIALNGELVHALADAYDASASENTLDLTLTIVDTSLIAEEDDTNNTQTISVPYVFFEDEDVIASSKSESAFVESGKIISKSGFYEVLNTYGQTYGDKSKVAIQLSFANGMAMTANRGIGAAEATGSFKLFMFNQSITLLGSDVSGKIEVGALDGEYDVSVVLLGSTILSDSDTVYEYSEEWSRDWSEEKTLFKTTFTIAIVPVSVSAGISGSVGIGASLEADSGVITATGIPFTASVDAFAEAAIDLGVASGGVRLDFLIISEELSIEAYADLSQFAFGGNFTIGLDVTNELKAIEGEFSLFVRYTGYEFCCSFPKKEATKTIYNTGALYDKTWNLLSVERTVNLF